MQIEYEYMFGDGTTEKRKIKTYADLIRSKILDWIEMERDQLITSMIDAMGDEYEEIKERADNDRGVKANDYNATWEEAVFDVISRGELYEIREMNSGTTFFIDKGAFNDAKGSKERITAVKRYGEGHPVSRG